MVNILDSKSSVARLVGSSPTFGTILKTRSFEGVFCFLVTVLDTILNICTIPI